MPLHNTEERQAGPTSAIESESFNLQSDSYEFPKTRTIPDRVR
jgi:hypothetical protein